MPDGRVATVDRRQHAVEPLRRLLVDDPLAVIHPGNRRPGPGHTEDHVRAQARVRQTTARRVARQAGHTTGGERLAVARRRLLRAVPVPGGQDHLGVPGTGRIVQRVLGLARAGDSGNVNVLTGDGENVFLRTNNGPVIRHPHRHLLAVDLADLLLHLFLGAIRRDVHVDGLAVHLINRRLDLAHGPVLGDCDRDTPVARDRLNRITRRLSSDQGRVRQVRLHVHVGRDAHELPGQRVRLRGRLAHRLSVRHQSVVGVDQPITEGALGLASTRVRVQQLASGVRETLKSRHVVSAGLRGQIQRGGVLCRRSRQILQRLLVAHRRRNRVGLQHAHTGQRVKHTIELVVQFCGLIREHAHRLSDATHVRARVHLPQCAQGLGRVLSRRSNTLSGFLRRLHVRRQVPHGDPVQGRLISSLARRIRRRLHRLRIRGHVLLHTLPSGEHGGPLGLGGVPQLAELLSRRLGVHGGKRLAERVELLPRPGCGRLQAEHSGTERLHVRVQVGRVRVPDRVPEVPDGIARGEQVIQGGEVAFGGVLEAEHRVRGLFKALRRRGGIVRPTLQHRKADERG